MIGFETSVTLMMIEEDTKRMVFSLRFLFIPLRIITRNSSNEVNMLYNDKPIVLRMLITSLLV
ncbi:hypothetical protein J31TS4_37500 [Paenibacillus sp. J31TS4]|nr:hypothetical protein J31TS4_37500 [Paenibacillus sp. J31TS4]